MVWATSHLLFYYESTNSHFSIAFMVFSLLIRLTDLSLTTNNQTTFLPLNSFSDQYTGGINILTHEHLNHKTTRRQTNRHLDPGLVQPLHDRGLPLIDHTPLGINQSDQTQTSACTLPFDIHQTTSRVRIHPHHAVQRIAL